MNSGNLRRVASERPDDTEMMSTARWGSMPARMPTTMASAVAVRHAADSTLLTIFMAWPVPMPPTWKMVLAHQRQERPRPVEIGNGAADHDGQGRAPGSTHAARHRRVDHARAARFDLLGQ